MYIAKKILVKSTVSLCAGIASSIGMRVGYVIWDSYIRDKIKTENNESYAQ